MTDLQTIPNITDKKRSVFVDGVLFDLDLYWWKGWTQLELKDIDKEEGELPDIFKLGKKRILNHEAFKDFQLIETRSRSLVNKLSYPFMISTVRFVPFTTLTDMTKELLELRKAFEICVDIFVFLYDDNKTAFINRYSKFADKLSTKYPDSAEIRRKFYFGYKFFEMAMPQDIRAEVVDEVQLEVLKGVWSDSRAQVDIQLSNWIETVGIEMRKEIELICKKMKDSLEAGKVIRDSTLDRTRETIKRLRKMNFIEDLQVESMILDLERSLPSSFNKDVPQIMESFKGTLQGIMKEAGDLSDVSEFTGQYKRKFML